MSTCLVAQSGGPTAVINASLAGVIRANQLNPLYDRVLGGIHGIEGVLTDQLYDLTDLSEHDLELLRQTPSSALGTCRYKLKRDDEADFRRLADVMDAHDIGNHVLHRRQRLHGHRGRAGRMGGRERAEQALHRHSENRGQRPGTGGPLPRLPQRGEGGLPDHARDAPRLRRVHAPRGGSCWK